MRTRADTRLVELGHFQSRAQAQAAIRAGLVRVDGRIVSKPSELVAEGACIEARAAHPYVSRAALKLVAALDHFRIAPAGRVCLDVGASTGGFTQVLLERGAARVYAVDVGRGQLHDTLKRDPRVVSLEAMDARSLTPAEIPEPPSLVVCDASFIGLEKVLERPMTLAEAKADLVALFKPQFQVGRAHVGKGGIVSDPGAVELAMEKARAWLQDAGWAVAGSIESPIAGGDGNREFLIAARKG